MTSVEEIAQVWTYDPSTGLLRWNIDAGPRRPKGQLVGAGKPGQYVHVKLNGWGYKVHRLAWALHYGAWPAHEIDHINGVRSDNRICNLRDVTHQQNQMNQACHRRWRAAA